MRILVLSAILGLMVGCASAPEQKQEREPAAAPAKVCEVEKHPKQEWYRLTVHGKPAMKSWYTQDQANKHMAKYEKKGACK